MSFPQKHYGIGYLLFFKFWMDYFSCIIFRDLVFVFQAVETEPENEVLSEHMYALAKCVEFLGCGCLSEPQLQEVGRLLDKNLKAHFERAVKRQEQRKVSQN